MKEKIKIAFIGIGRRGSNILNTLAKMDDVEIAVLCDKYEPAIEKGLQILKEQNRPLPMTTTDADVAIHHPDTDAVFIMTGWTGRPALAKKAMLAKKYTAIEVGCALDLSECYDLIETYEQTKTPLMMLENCCYGRREMMALRLVKEGLFGEIVHCDGGYCHYLPACDLFKEPDSENQHYRVYSYIHRNCEQYPTHELGPISKVLNINRGNRFMTLASFSSKAVGLKDAAKTLLGEDHRFAKADYKHGDIITTIITCANGETIRLTLDTTLPRAYYSRGFTVRGTKGMYTEERRVVYFEGMEEPIENNEEEMFEKYDHPLHKEYHAKGERGGHGGMDWLVCRGFIESVKRGTNTPIDAYDTVSWLAVAPLSEMSIQLGGAPVSFPDFTKGLWYDREAPTKSKYSLDEIIEDNTVPIY